ncbi:MAG: sulfate ABC transporter permease subunit CysT [Anaerolineaceae bacterium]|nr:sulfate ABC transporter permease subunit CysT [Anaerolineaceae bacterium]
MDLALNQGGRKTGVSKWFLRVPALLYVTLMILVPLLVIVEDGFREGLSGLIHQISVPIAQHAILLTLWTAALMTLINAIMGLATAYVLVRYEFPGKRLLNAIVDLPLAIPTLVTGVMLVMLYGPQSTLGSFLSQKIGLDIIFAPPGIVVALLFISFPFVVRSIQPVLMNLDLSQEKAAATLGAKPWYTFRTIVLPTLLPPLISGSLLSFSRAIGEFGAVVIVAGNIPLKTQTAAVYVLGAVESENRLGASAISLLLLAIAIIVLMAANQIQKAWGARHEN